jgi:hypothetical protein
MTRGVMRKARDECLDDSCANGSDGIHDVALLHPNWQCWFTTEPFANCIVNERFGAGLL